MIQSILVYGIQMFVLIQLALISAKRETLEENNNFFNWEIFFSLILFAFIAGVRYDVGVDYLMYHDDYLTLLNGGLSDLKNESLFGLFTTICTSLGLNVTIYFGLIGFVQIFFIYYAFKNERYVLPFIIFVLLTNGTYFTLMNGIRQTIVLCIFIFAVKYIKEKNIVKFLIFVFISYFIHKSVLILIPMYFVLVIDKDYFKSIWLQIILLLMAFVLSSSAIWNYFTAYLDGIITFLGYADDYGDMDRMSEIFEQDYSKGIRFYFPFLINIIIAVFSFKIKDSFRDTRIKIYYNLYFIGAVANMLFYNNPLFRRPFMYFMYINIIVTGYLFAYLWKNIRVKFYFPIFILLIIMHMAILYVYIASNLSTYYYFIWQQ